jgi:putative oxidoreductase
VPFANRLSPEENDMTFLTKNAHWLLRIALASVFVYHGVLKLQNLDGFAQMLPISYLQVVLVALAETAGGLLVLAGGFRNDRISDLATRIGAALNIPVIIGAITIVHWGQWNFVPSETHPMGGFEFQAVLLLLMLYLTITGNTAFATTPEKSTQTSHFPATASAVAG